MASFTLEPSLVAHAGDVVAGDAAERGTDRVLLGKIAEAGPSRRLWLDISGEQVVGIFGKRGTGKSYTLGVLVEGLAAQDKGSAIADLSTPRGGLVLDIMGIYWATQVPLTPDGPPELARQHELMSSGGLETESLAVDVWIPAGFQRPEIDPEGVNLFSVRPIDISLDDWAALFGLDIYGEPRGNLLADLVRKVGQDGYTNRRGEEVVASDSYTLTEMITCLETDTDIEGEYRDDTVRSIKQRLRTLEQLDLFGETGTSLGDLIRAGRVSILMLNRLSDELKKVLTAVLVRGILRERGDASFAQKRLDLDSSCSDQERLALKSKVEGSIPRTWLCLDEAHVLAGHGEKSTAREMLVKYAKEGRNYGLSLAVATQQPSVLDSRLTSQIETLIVHQLTSPEDANLAVKGMRSPQPENVLIDGTRSDLQRLLRQLVQGMTVFSSGNAPGLSRAAIVRIRPRISGHGGYEA